MNDSNTTKVFYEKFYEFEKEYNLLEIGINNVKFWQIIRFGVLSDLKKKVFKSGQTNTLKNSISDKIKALPKLTYNFFTKNPLCGNYNKEILIFDHARKVKVDNNYIDIYTNYFINQIKFKNYQVIEAPYQRKHYTSRKLNHIKYNDAMTLTKFIKKRFGSNEIQKKDLHKLKVIEGKLNKKFDVNINLVKRSKVAIEIFIYEYNYYIKLLNKRKPKLIYLVVSYSHPALIAAAKSLEIKVVEFQHGVITPYHVAYNYPHATHEIDYFPNKILTFGEYWNTAAAFPKDVELEAYGFPYLNDRRDLYEYEDKNKKQILFLSQGTIGKELSELAYKVSQLLPNYKILYKLHPGEYGRWKSIYPDLIKASLLNNFEVIDHNEKELYYYLSESNYVSGVYSTAIFESLAFGCNAILYNTNGIEYMEDLVKENIVEVVNDEKEFLNCLKIQKNNEFDKSYFFK